MDTSGTARLLRRAWNARHHSSLEHGGGESPTVGHFVIGFGVFMAFAFVVIAYDKWWPSGESATEPSPVALVEHLIQGNAPGSLKRFGTYGCSVSAAGPDVYSAYCDGMAFLVNVRTLTVVPGDAATGRRWEAQLELVK